ncbi:HD domain-containing protein [Methanocella sp. MCL-LM]|uniref:HD domain-containing protein n=1 Tax=Methanocella sp. MCL-LM TaxID=3412035 RepID=UPI003C78F7B8
MIPTISDIVEKACLQDANRFGYGIWKYHIVNVVAFAKELAAKTGADTEIVELAALLHDYASIKDFSQYEEHHIHGAREAEALLANLGYPEEKIRQVQYCIYCHRGSVPVEKATKEAICVADADSMSHFAAIPSLYYLAFQKKGMGVEEANAWITAKLARSWKKLSPQGKDAIKEEYEAFKLLLGCK